MVRKFHGNRGIFVYSVTAHLRPGTQTPALGLQHLCYEGLHRTSGVCACEEARRREGQRCRLSLSTRTSSRDIRLPVRSDASLPPVVAICGKRSLASPHRVSPLRVERLARTRLSALRRRCVLVPLCKQLSQIVHACVCRFTYSSAALVRSVLNYFLPYHLILARQSV
jgi:hypothetical protein